MHPYMIQDLARVQIANQLGHDEQARPGRQVRVPRSPRRRLVAAKGFQWLSPWFSRQRGPRAA